MVFLIPTEEGLNVMVKVADAPAGIGEEGVILPGVKSAASPPLGNTPKILKGAEPAELSIV